MKKYILALDQGNTSSRAVLFDKRGHVLGLAQKEFPQLYPQAGWVEHNPMEIWGTQMGVAREVMETTGVSPMEVAAIGITNQRESTILWDKNTGTPIYNGIVWQCRRSAGICDELKEKGWGKYIKEKTGLVIDAYFSATKVKWILEHVEGAREKAEKGDLLFGTVDSWLVWNLTKGEKHITDYTNASRTMLYNIKERCWDERILEELRIPPQILPQVEPSSCIYAYTHPSVFGGIEIPIAGIAGDQHASLFGQHCFEPGMVKNTYGTGCFMLMNTGEDPIDSQQGLLTTIAWGLEDRVDYALEGSVFVAGAVIQWLRDELQMIDSAAQSKELAERVPDTNGAYIVPAFTGLGAPYWDMYARGTIVGITRGTNRNHLVRAALESIAYQSKELLESMEQDSGIQLQELRVDGGAVANNFLMQFQADILGSRVVRPRIIESTALGAAYLAGLAVGFWKDIQEIKGLNSIDRMFRPKMEEKERQRLFEGWKKAVQRSLTKA